MRVAFNIKGETIHHAIDVDTNDHREAIAAVKGLYRESFKDLNRCFALIQGGRGNASNVPMLNLNPQQSA